MTRRYSIPRKDKFKGITERIIKHFAPPEMKIGKPDDRFPGAGVVRFQDLWAHIKDRWNAIMSDPGWPKVGRNKEITCPVTGEQTNHAFGLSQTAWKVLEVGIQTLEDRAVKEVRFGQIGLIQRVLTLHREQANQEG